MNMVIQIFGDQKRCRHKVQCEIVLYNHIVNIFKLLFSLHFLFGDVKASSNSRNRKKLTLKRNLLQVWLLASDIRL